MDRCDDVTVVTHVPYFSSRSPAFGHEVQIKTPEMHEAALEGHKYYEQSREMERIHAIEPGSPKFDIPPEKKAHYDFLIAEQLRVYGDAAAVTDPEILAQLVPKFIKGGAVVAGPRFFRMSFQN